MEGQKPKTALHKGFLGILHSTSDWNLKLDLNGMLVVSVFLTVSTFYPLLFSMSTTKVIIIEMTYPCEENMSHWHGERF